MKAIRIHEHGGPEVLRFEEMTRPIPCATEVLVLLLVQMAKHRGATIIGTVSTTEKAQVIHTPSLALASSKEKV